MSGAGTSKASNTTNQASQTTTNPWAPTTAGLTSITNSATGLANNAGSINPTQSGALDTLQRNANAGNPYAPQIGMNATNLLQGGGAMAQAPAVSQNLDNYMSQLTPYANGSQVGQISPQLQSYLDQIRGDVTNSVNGMFAGSGRDLSGMNQQTLSRGIAQGEAQPLLAQYNTDQQRQIEAANDIYGAGNSTAGILGGMQNQANTNTQAGTGASNDALQARDSAANQQLAIQAQKMNIPVAQLQHVMGILGPIAQLGGTSNTVGQSNSNSTQTASALQQMQQMAQIFSSISGGGKSAGWWGGGGGSA